MLKTVQRFRGIKKMFAVVAKYAIKLLPFLQNTLIFSHRFLQTGLYLICFWRMFGIFAENAEKYSAFLTNKLKTVRCSCQIR